MRRSMFVFLSACVAAGVLCGGCGKREGDEPTKYTSQEGLARLTKQAQETSGRRSQATGGTSVNPAFLVSSGLSAKDPTAQDLDRVVRPVLKSVFGDAKLIAESSGPETRKDGEVIENRLTYAVKRVLAGKDGEALHAALRAAHFSTSPRLGSKPTIIKTFATMSFFKTTSRRSYSLVFNIDAKKQQLVVESYQLGSKYDRLM
ncbi:MAG: hypothetical protein PHO59_05230 [Candidatus Omnitrophica bacterium]|nr:hypothetical protein [Candidatus Omnitrophota bacterium]